MNVILIITTFSTNDLIELYLEKDNVLKRLMPNFIDKVKKKQTNNNNNKESLQRTARTKETIEVVRFYT